MSIGFALVFLLVGAVVKSAGAGKFDYLVAQLADPSFIKPKI